MGEVIRMADRRPIAPRWRMPLPGFHALEIPRKGKRAHRIAVISRGVDCFWWWAVFFEDEHGEYTHVKVGRTLSGLPDIKAKVMEAIANGL